VARAGTAHDPFPGTDSFNMATDFFERQRRARSQSLWLRVVFAFAMVAASALAAAGFVLLLGSTGMGGLVGPRGGAVLSAAFVHGTGGWIITAVLLAFSLGVSGWTAWKLRDGGPGLARRLRGTPVDPGTTDPRYRPLVNVIAEMALAAGMPAPQAWVLEHEGSINAFAAGRKIESAVVGVTGGALDQLDRDELQAVIAHEFSHIRNGDMALNTRMIAWVSGLFAIEGLARALRGDPEKSKSASRVFFWWMHLGFWVFHACGYIGLFIGRLLQAAISRRREALADASAVQFTRNPNALRSALLKIEADSGLRRLDSRAAAGMAHMFFSSTESGLGNWIERLQSGLLRTHPPTLERVRQLDRNLTETQFRAAVRIVRKERLDEKARAEAPVLVAGETLRPAASPTRSRDDPPPELLGSRLNATQQHAVRTLQLDVAQSAHRLQALFVAALLDRDDARGKVQLLQLVPVLGADVTSRVAGVATLLQELAPVARLPLLAGLVPRLAALPDKDRAKIVKVARAFATRITPYDALRFATARLVLRGLLQVDAPRVTRGPDDPPLDLADWHGPIGLLCSVFAQIGGERAPQVFRAGIEGWLPPLRRPDFTATPIGGADFDAALDAVATLPYVQRSALCQALARIAVANGTLDAREFDLLRLVSLTLGVTTPSTGVTRLGA
jgi:Zn-dependent protease with chaperone function